jgi:cation/acetate symporter
VRDLEGWRLGEAVDSDSILRLTMLFALAAVVAIALNFRSGRLSQFYVAGREIAPAANGAAIFASIVLPIALMLGLQLEEGDALVLGLAAVLGLLVSAAIFAPYLRSFGGYSLPDFLGERYGEAARIVALLLLVLCSLPLLVVALSSLAALAATLFDLAPSSAIWIVAAFLVVCALFGGMRAVSFNQAALGVLFLAAALVAIAKIKWLGSGVQDHEAVDAAVSTFSLRDGADRIGSVVTIAAAAACFPHMVMHSFVTPTVRGARISFLWGAVFLALFSLVCATEPEIFKSLLPGAASGLRVAPLLFCALAANLAIALGLLIAVANSLAHDLYFKTFDRMVTQSQQLLVLRAMLVIVAGAAALIALIGDDFSDWAVGSLSLAAAAFFPALVLGLWWRRANQPGVIAGIAAAVALALFYLLVPYYFPGPFYEAMHGLSGGPQDQWPHYLTLKQAAHLADGYAKQAATDAWINEARNFAKWGGVDRHYAALFAIPVGFVVAVVVSLCTARPGERVENFVGELGRVED